MASARYGFETAAAAATTTTTTTTAAGLNLVDLVVTSVIQVLLTVT